MSEANRIVPDQKITGEEKIESAPRVGEDLRARNPVDKEPPDKEKEAKAEPDLRRHICGDKPCESPEPKPVEPEKDARHRPCVKGPCPCPPGEKTSTGGCIATVVQNNECPAGQVWNGGACLTQTCPPNEIWNGIRCVPTNDCLAIETSAAHLIQELRALSANREEACAQDPSGQECLDLTQEHAVRQQEYRMLHSQASPACWNRLPDPDTL